MATSDGAVPPGRICTVVKVAAIAGGFTQVAGESPTRVASLSNDASIDVVPATTQARD